MPAGTPSASEVPDTLLVVVMVMQYYQVLGPSIKTVTCSIHAPRIAPRSYLARSDNINTACYYRLKTHIDNQRVMFVIAEYVRNRLFCMLDVAIHDLFSYHDGSRVTPNSSLTKLAFNRVQGHCWHESPTNCGSFEA